MLVSKTVLQVSLLDTRTGGWIFILLSYLNYITAKNCTKLREWLLWVTESCAELQRSRPLCSSCVCGVDALWRNFNPNIWIILCFAVRIGAQDGCLCFRKHPVEETTVCFLTFQGLKSGFIITLAFQYVCNNEHQRCWNPLIWMLIGGQDNRKNQEHRELVSLS